MKTEKITYMVLLFALSAFLISFKPAPSVQEPGFFHCTDASTFLGLSGSSTMVNLTLSGTAPVTFQTNCVNGSSSYLWTIDGTVSTTSSANTISLSPSYFLWLPATGCEGFNEHLSGTTYYTTFSVQSDASSTAATISVAITNVGECTNGEYEFPEIP